MTKLRIELPPAHTPQRKSASLKRSGNVPAARPIWQHYESFGTT